MPTLAFRLKLERKRLGFTQSQLAVAGGVTTNAQLHYENGDRIPRGDYLAALAGSNIDLLYVVTGNRTPIQASGLSEVEDEVIAALRMLGEKEFDVIMVIMSRLSIPRMSR
ncbi:helix-turn-helix transcriptional regulator [Pseudomonas sp. CCC2.2]|uniref:helix-turn-helix domain-containing protein n=1 Tax=Pseudomonas sp. CCC2.2 TaxID=3048605 RepID=UPI002B222075|nr:helix-turn-helix transcriptional regulator [Pseudomonas sp. CCC2.2]MEB0149042.1 helix-turn-helix transcriptional regulator [Pseudomonas sp. CCC2.2]